MLLVVGYHAFPGRIPGGFVGVDVFFVISGFLITGIIAGELAKGSFSFLDFYLRRSRRIFPALVLVLICSWMLGFATLTGKEFRELGTHLVAGASFTSNFALLTETGYFDGPGDYKPLLHLWSLAVEEQYYLFWPLMLLLLSRSRHTLLAITGLGLASFWLNIAADAGTAFYMLPMRMWELLIGGALAIHASRDHGSTAGNGIGSTGLARNAFSIAGLALIGGAAFAFDASHPYPGWRAAVPSVGTAMVIAGGSNAAANRFVLSRNLVVLVGLISYPLYLWHWPLLSIFNVVKWQAVPEVSLHKWVRLALVATSFGLAYLTYRALELPLKARLDAYCRGRGQRVRTQWLLMLSLLLVALLGVSTVALNGMPLRHKVLDPDQFERHAMDISKEGFDLELQGFQECTSRYKALKGVAWCLQEDAQSHDMAVVGDSHARSLFPGLVQALSTGKKHDLILVAGCPPLIGVTVHDRGAADECAQANAGVLAQIVADAKITTVVLASRGPLYSTGVGFGLAEAAVGKMLGSPGAHSGDATRAADLFVRGYSRMASALLAAGKRVVFVIDVPELGFFPIECLVSRPFQRSDHALRSPCAIDVESVRSRQSEYRDLVGRISHANPGMLVFDAVPSLCDEGLCHAYRQGNFMYMDTNHLSIHGSRLVGRSLAEFLRQAP